jgi:hypothetical protein
MAGKLMADVREEVLVKQKGLVKSISDDKSLSKLVEILNNVDNEGNAD